MRIVRAARQLGLAVFATPFDEPSLRLLARLEIPVTKIGSGEVTHTPFLAAAARTGEPINLSPGGCELADVDRAIETLRGAGCARPALLHCVSAYPPPDEQVHLRVLGTLTQRYPDLTIGYSDHTLGIEAAIAALEPVLATDGIQVRAEVTSPRIYADRPTPTDAGLAPASD